MMKYVLALLALATLNSQKAYSQCTADAGPEFILTCVTTQVTLQGSSNVPAATYSWSGPGGFSSNLQNPVVNEAGDYFLTITDPSNNCTATATTGVFLNTMPPVVSVTGGTLTCAQPSITLVTSVTPANCVFEWLGPNNFTSTQQSPTVSWPGVYSITVTNPSNGCTTVESAIVTQNITAPDISATGGSISCGNPFVTLTASSNTPGVTYSWTGPGGFSSNTQNPQANVEGSYTVIVTAPNGCTASQVVQITLDGFVILATGDITDATCFGANNGSIDITVTAGTPPFTFLWSDGSTTEDLNNLAAGTYSVTVTDNTGCWSRIFVIVSQPADISLAANQITISPVTCFGQANGAIAIPTPTGGTPGFTYSWGGPNSFTSTTKNITGLAGGMYNLTITDSKGCSKTFQYSVIAPTAPLSITTLLYCENSISVAASGGVQPYTYAWRWNGPTGPVIASGPSPSNLLLGNYFLVVIDNNGCTASATYFIGPNSTSCTRITGQILLDENLNCLADTLESGMGNWFLKAEGLNGTFYGLSGSNGRYNISLEPGDYTLSLIPQGYQPFICQNDIPVSLLQTGDSTEVDFLVQLPDPDCASLSINISTPVLRRCFSNNHYYVQCCNNGTAEATDVYFTLDLDPLLTIQAAEIPYTDLGNNQFRFDLGTLPPNFCDNIWVRVQVSCSAILGQTHCTEAHIYPDTLCAPTDPQWSGAQLEVRSECVGDSLHFIIKNIGGGNMGQVLDYIVIEDGIMNRQGSAAPLQSGQTMTVSVPANGATWRIEADQVPFSPRPDPPVLTVEACSNTGSFTTGFVNQFPLPDNGAWVDVDCTPNTGSYDPNDKQGFPIGYGPNHYIRPGTEIEYLIRFQNTGTDTAFAVVIRDTLSPWLDPLTVHAGVSSHPYRFELAGEGTLIFDFQNILLPDSNVNEPESHGFVRFSIRTRTDMPLETDIPNAAAIYFDFNDPVITNTTMHRIGTNHWSLGLWQVPSPLYEVLVAPHPVQDASWVSLAPTRRTAWSPPTNMTGHFTLRLYDLSGRPVRSLEASEPRFLLRKMDLPAGVYLFKIENERVLLGSGKLVVK